MFTRGLGRELGGKFLCLKRFKMTQKYHFIHERGDYPPLAVENVARNWSGHIKKTVGSGETPLFFLYQKGQCLIYSYESKHQEIINYVFNKISKNKAYITKVKDIFDQRSRVIEKFIKELETSHFRSLSNQELIEIKNKYNNLYDQILPYGEPLPHFLKEKLHSVLKEYFIDQKKITEAEFELLITPNYQSFLSKENQELFKIFKKFSRFPDYLNNQLKRHYQKYKWILFDYSSIIVNLKYFQKRAGVFGKTPPEIADYAKLKRQKSRIIKKYKVDLKFQYYLDILDKLYYLMDKKKEILTHFHFAITPLYKEVGRRLGLSLEEVRWFLWSELKDVLENKPALTGKIAASREKFSVIKFYEGRADFLDFGKSQKIVKDIRADQQALVNKLKGTPASAGKVRGTVCYLKSAKENNKIKKGQILVVSNTTPDFMPALKKAAAIVTNEGGLTCHAAIVSRELKIPSIVGTKIATQVFKDGDLVEVDANLGIIKKI